jgi:hypothetical protein
MAATGSLPALSKDTMHEDRFTELPEELARNIISLLRTPYFFALYIPFIEKVPRTMPHHTVLDFRFSIVFQWQERRRRICKQIG